MEMLIISSQPDGYRRAGLTLNQGENHIDPDDLSPDQLRLLSADPRLTVVGGEQLTDPELLRLVDLIAELDPDDQDLWTADGKPKSQSMPKNTTAQQRQAAWELFQQRQAGSEK